MAVFFASVKSRKLRHLGHGVQKNNSPEKDIIQSTLSGRRKRGRRQKTSRTDSITSWTGLHLEDVLRNNANRSNWKTAANARNAEG